MLAAMESVLEPSLGGRVQHGESVEIRHGIFWEGMEVLWDGLGDGEGDGGDEGEQEDGEHIAYAGNLIENIRARRPGELRLRLGRTFLWARK